MEDHGLLQLRFATKLVSIKLGSPSLFRPLFPVLGGGFSLKMAACYGFDLPHKNVNKVRKMFAISYYFPGLGGGFSGDITAC